MPEDPATRAAEDAFGEQLEAAQNEPVNTPEQAEAAASVAEPVVEAPGTTPDEPIVQEDSFRGFDESLLSTLSPEIQAAVKAQQASMQGDYTRKTQEAAELRKQFEGLDPEVARQSVAYVQRLSSDPQFLIEAHSEISQALEQMGYTPETASAAAASALDEQDDDEVFGGVPPEIQNQLAELQAWKSQVEQERYQTYVANETMKQEMSIRQMHPEYTDDDIGNIMTIGWSTGGDLLKAGEQYAEMEAFFAKKLLTDKASVPAAISPPPVGGAATQADDPKALDFEGAHKAAMEALRNVMAND